jgi:hypothetical protein|tara:strand:- start:1265 stop:1549 length:285 start_codon:yes stop_codon:yes gene_type:complete
MIEIISISILSVLVVVLGFISFNLLKKNEKQEDILVEYLTYLENISKTIEISDKKLNEIDNKGTFKSDDEVGYFFKSIKQIQKILNEFKVKEIK